MKRKKLPFKEGDTVLVDWAKGNPDLDFLKEKFLKRYPLSVARVARIYEYDHIFYRVGNIEKNLYSIPAKLLIRIG
jgi:hypothetical protein